jgi:8-oxo-dGTP pyrophosphatase MutT (NUDIX family)
MGGLRETQEEIGLAKKHLQLIGRLSPLYMAHTNMSIQPVVAELMTDETLTEFTLSYEVEEFFWVILEDLIHEKTIQFKTDLIRDSTVTYPFWDVHKTVPLWGATAMILSELLELYHEFNQEKSVH